MIRTFYVAVVLDPDSAKWPPSTSFEAFNVKLKDVPADMDVADFKKMVKAEMTPRLDYCSPSELKVFTDPKTEITNPRTQVLSVTAGDSLYVLAPPAGVNPLTAQTRLSFDNAQRFADLLRQCIEPDPRVIAKLATAGISFGSITTREEAKQVYDDYAVTMGSTTRRVLAEDECVVNGKWMGLPHLYQGIRIKDGAPIIVKIIRRADELALLRALEPMINMTIGFVTYSLLPPPPSALDSTEGPIHLPNGLLIMEPYCCNLRQSAPFPLLHLVKNTRRMFNALQSFHVSGWLHCDVKEENIFIDKNGLWFLGDFDVCVRAGSDILSTTSWCWLASDLPFAWKPGASMKATAQHDTNMLRLVVALQLDRLWRIIKSTEYFPVPKWVDDAGSATDTASSATRVNPNFLDHIKMLLTNHFPDTAAEFNYLFASV